MNIIRPFAGLLLAATSTILRVSGAAPDESTVLQSVQSHFNGENPPAVSAAVLKAGAVISVHTGALSSTATTPPDSRTLYEIGSISKVFTALLLADAVVRGEVTLDTTIGDLLPDDVTLPDNAEKRITLAMLATHTSGLPRIPAELPADDYRDPYAGYGDAELWATLRRVTLDYPPGTKSGYSNLAAGLLGTLLARNARTTYAALLEARITGPLGMKDTVVKLRDELRPRFAPPTTSTGKPWTPWEFKALAGAGGIRSTLADMTIFATAILQPPSTPLGQAIDLAWKKQDIAASLSPGGQALGWMIAGDGKTRWHNGMTGGFHAALFVHREFAIATLVLSNRSTPTGTGVAEELMRRAAGLPERPIPNRDRAEVAVTEEQLDRCTGTFRITPQFALVFQRQNTTLYLTPTGQSTDRLYAAAADTYFSRRVAAEIIFEFPADGGPAHSLVLKQSGREVRASRE